jgi:hypothetical protein
MSGEFISDRGDTKWVHNILFHDPKGDILGGLDKAAKLNLC